MKAIFFAAVLCASTPAFAQYSDFQMNMDMMQLDMDTMADDMDQLTDQQMQRHPGYYRHAPHQESTCLFRQVLPFMPCFP